MKQMYKVLTKDMRPPIQGGNKYILHKWYSIPLDESNRECAQGFYAIPVSELINYHKPWQNTKVVSVLVGGKSKYFSESKQRYERMIIDKVLSDAEIIALCKIEEPKLGYKLSEALYPVNPLNLPLRNITDDDIDLLTRWASVRASVRDSVWASVRDSVWAYIGSMFYKISKWKYVIHDSGEYPFQAAVDLWNRGLLPTFDGKLWRLHSGVNAEIVWTEPKSGLLEA